MSGNHPPNYFKFHASVTKELRSLRDRVRSLVSHWPSDGEWKESVLRALLRRYLPDSIFIGRGFIVTENRCSTQLDILVLRPNSPKIFQDGDLVIVTPDAVKAIVEVKTRVNSDSEWREIIEKLADVGDLCKPRFWVSSNSEQKSELPWLGIFVYEGDMSKDKIILKHLKRVYEENWTFDKVSNREPSPIH